METESKYNNLEISLIDLAAISILPEIYQKANYDSKPSDLASLAYDLATYLVLERRKRFAKPESSV